MNKLYYEIFCAYVPESDDEDIYETKIIYKTKIFETIPPPDFTPTNEYNYQKIKKQKYIKKHFKKKSN